jgi:restriction system protein
MSKRTGLFTDLMELASKLPWTVGVGLALVTAVTFHVIAIKTVAPTTPSNVGDLGLVVVHQLAHLFATMLQYLVPAGLLIGATASFIKTWQRRALFSQTRINPMASIAGMTWQQFEMLVGEAFRRRGFSVAETGGNGPDGGVDLVLSKAGERYFVQCKHWRSRQVGVTVVRELYGVMAAQGATGGYVVAAGYFTKDALEFAKRQNIELIDSNSIVRLLSEAALETSDDPSAARARPAPTSEAQPVVAVAGPSCPRCGTIMVERVAKQGQYAGQRFWGCRRYPRCREILRTG